MLLKLPKQVLAGMELGFVPVAQNFWYRLGLRRGWYRGDIDASHDPDCKGVMIRDPFGNNPDLPLIKTVLGISGTQSLLHQAKQILRGHYLEFGHRWVPIDLQPGDSTVHWVDLELGLPTNRTRGDIKLVWEPARFCWAPSLAVANLLHPSVEFQNYFEKSVLLFQKANPPAFGPNWQSAQEVAIRLINILLTTHFFRFAGQDPLAAELPALVVTHANRIMQTLVYARSQNNNHYLSECVALVAAANAMPRHRDAIHWSKTGWRGIKWCLANQFEADGEYVQHSLNYHRLMLQLFLILYLLDHKTFTHQHTSILAKAAQWYAERVDPNTGLAPNLGANDGALLLAFSAMPFEDHRPTAQAALRVFAGQTVPAGTWDDLHTWLGLAGSTTPFSPSKARWVSTDSGLRAIMRAIRFHNRPSHADHLHTEIWLNGQAVALDAGTYSYNEPEPWQNALTCAQVHNTVTVDNTDQMIRVSKFLYSNWGTSTTLISEPTRTTAIADIQGEVRYTHLRSVHAANANSLVIDDKLVLPAKDDVHAFDLHWLLAGSNWSILKHDQHEMILGDGKDRRLLINVPSGISDHCITVGGKSIAGNINSLPTHGWVSPSYYLKVPATSIAIRTSTPGVCVFSSRFEITK